MPAVAESLITPAPAAAPASAAATGAQPTATPSQPATNQPAAGTPAATETKPAGDAAAKPAEAAKPVVPEKYELKLPEGSPLKVEALAETAKALGLSQEQAQKFAEAQNAAVSTHVEALQTQHQANVTKWVEDIKADPELGGKNFDANAERARQAIAKFGTPALKKALDETGFGNHPELFRLAANIGKAMAEDTFNGTAQPTPARPKTLADKLYPE